MKPLPAHSTCIILNVFVCVCVCCSGCGATTRGLSMPPYRCPLQLEAQPQTQSFAFRVLPNRLNSLQQPDRRVHLSTQAVILLAEKDVIRERPDSNSQGLVLSQAQGTFLGKIGQGLFVAML